MERKWRNLLIALATSIGFVGVLISFGLGNALISMIDENTNGGQIPSQVQIALNTENAGRGFLNQDEHVKYYYRWSRNGSESNDAFLCSSSESL